MKKHLLAIEVIALTLMSCAAGSAVWARSYVVKEGDTLSEIAHDKLGPPVYGENGTLEALLSKNPDIKDPDHLYPGQTLNLEDAPATPQTAEQTPEQTPVQTPQAEEARKPASIDTPAAVPVEEESQPEPSAPTEHHFTISPVLAYSSLSGTDKINGGSATLASSLDYGVNLRYGQSWRKWLQVYAELGLLSATYNSPDTRPLTGASQTYFDFHLGADWRAGERWDFQAELGAEQTPVIRAASAQTLQIDNVFLPDLRVGTGYTLWEQNRAALRALVGGGLTIPVSTANYQTQLGYFFDAKILFRDRLSESTSLEISPFFRDQQINSTIVNETYEELGLSIGLSWSF